VVSVNLKPGLSLDNIAELIEHVEARFTGDPRRREPAALCLSSEGGAARGKPGLARSRAWHEAVLSGLDLVRFAWLTLRAFLRIATNPRMFEHPLPRPKPKRRFPAGSLSQPLGFSTRANAARASCAVFCAMDRLAVRWSWTPSSPQSRSNTATVCTTDRDFSRFSGLKWTKPLAENR
jgi:hypothetical protein